MNLTLEKIEELSFDIYVNKQKNAIEKAYIVDRLKNIKKGNKFIYGNGWKGRDYEGFAIVSMVQNNPNNDVLISFIDRVRKYLQSIMNENSDDFYFLPRESYHQTVANTLSAQRFHDFIKSKNLEVEYPAMVGEAFTVVPSKVQGRPIEMKIIGLSVFGSSFGLIGTFEEERTFKRITQFRDSIYSNPILNVHDVKRTRPFIGHITLGYFEGQSGLSNESVEVIANKFEALNDELQELDLSFTISNTELRKYYDLSEFNTHDLYPSYSFLK